VKTLLKVKYLLPAIVLLVLAYLLADQIVAAAWDTSSLVCGNSCKEVQLDEAPEPKLVEAGTSVSTKYILERS
jgi:hypothetical protein